MRDEGRRKRNENRRRRCWCFKRIHRGGRDRLGLLAPKVILLGGLFQRDGVYVHAFRRKLKKNLSDARVSMSEHSPELGAAWLASQRDEHAAVTVAPRESERANLARASTEQRNP